MDFYIQFRNIIQKMRSVSQEYDTLVPQIENSNYFMLTISSFFSMAIFFFIFLISLFRSETRFSPVSYLIISYSLVSFLFLFTNVLIIKNRRQFLRIFMYLFMMFIFSYAWYIDIFKNSHQTSVLFTILLFILPILFIDKSYRIFIFTILITILFVLSSFFAKSRSIFVRDLINAVVFLAMELFFIKYFSYLRLRDFLILYTATDDDFDELTGLLNRKAIEREITKHILISKDAGIVILIDFKNFKQLNDFYGMDFSDNVLTQVSEQLKTIFRNNDVFGRYDSDKFIVFMPNLKNNDAAKVRSELLLSALTENIKIPEDAFELSANIGITKCSEYDETTKSLLKRAEDALYNAKIKGFNKIVAN